MEFCVTLKNHEGLSNIHKTFQKWIRYYTINDLHIE